MQLTFTEMHTPTVGLQIQVDRQLHTEQSDFQRIDVFECEEFGRFLTLDCYMMLTERDEFIIYWLPKLEGNPYNLLSFQTDAYTNSAALTIDPAPDTLIRVFLAWKGLDAPVEVEPQTLTAQARTGFTAVEWGGAEVD